MRVAFAILTLFPILGRIVLLRTIKLFPGDPIESSISNFLIDHNATCLAPPPPKKKKMHNHYFQFHLGIK